MGLPSLLRLGRGEERTGGRRKAALWANAYEAVIAALYLDGGYERAALTVNFIRSLIDGGFADLHHPEYWDLGFVHHSPWRDQYRQIVTGLLIVTVVADRYVADDVSFADCLADDATIPGEDRQFQLIFTPDPQQFTRYRLSASTPGQTFYNLIVQTNVEDCIHHARHREFCT